MRSDVLTNCSFEKFDCSSVCQQEDDDDSGEDDDHDDDDDDADDNEDNGDGDYTFYAINICSGTELCYLISWHKREKLVL